MWSNNVPGSWSLGMIGKRVGEEWGLVKYKERSREPVSIVLKPHSSIQAPSIASDCLVSFLTVYYQHLVCRMKYSDACMISRTQNLHKLWQDFLHLKHSEWSKECAWSIWSIERKDVFAIIPNNFREYLIFQLLPKSLFFFCFFLMENIKVSNFYWNYFLCLALKTIILSILKHC